MLSHYHLPRSWFAIAVILLLPGLATAHPVTYAGGGLVDFMVGHDHSHIDFTYSPRPDLGYSLTYARVKDANHESTQFVMPRVNYLVKRWNAAASQANSYVWGGMGVARNSGDEDPAGLLGGQLDWETRRLYTSARLDSYLRPAGERNTFGVLRAGVAPYPVEFGQINLFLIGQLDYGSRSGERWAFSPVVRAFYDDYLMEVGVSTEGDVMVSGMVHFYLL